MIEKLLIPQISGRFSLEPAYREGHVRIVNPLPGTAILGLHIPDMKKTAKELALSSDCPALLDGFEQAAAGSLYYEEKIVWGLMLDYVKMPLDERLGRFSAFVPQIDNWAVCDTVCGAAKWADVLSVAAEARRAGCTADAYRAKIRREIWSFLLKWWRSDREFEVRFAVIMAMSHFLDEEWMQEVFRQLDTLDFGNIVSEYRFERKSVRKNAGDAVSRKQRSGEDSGCCMVPAGSGWALSGDKAGTVLGPEPYYVRMGVAWLLATSLAKYPEQTRAYVRGCRLPEDVLKLYARKARESFRTRTVSPF